MVCLTLPPVYRKRDFRLSGLLASVESKPFVDKVYRVYRIGKPWSTAKCLSAQVDAALRRYQNARILSPVKITRKIDLQCAR